jgi:2-hydroxymethylglutarate dehydrogenase
MDSLGFIGLGKMGGHMASCLLRNGFSLTVFDVRDEPMVLLSSRGAKKSDSVKAVAKECDVIFTSLPHPRISEEVILGREGLVENGKEGDIIVETSTVLPTLIRKINMVAQQKHISIVDAGVSGVVKGDGGPGVNTIMLGGDEGAIEKIHHVLQKLAKNVFRCGEVGAGMTVKLVNNSLSHVNWLGICEGMSVGVKAGADPKILYEVISQSGGGSVKLKERFLGRVLQRNFEPGMSVDMVCKDSELMLELARELKVPLFVNAIKHNVYRLAQASGLGQKDYSSVIQLWEKLLNIEIKK